MASSLIQNHNTFHITRHANGATRIILLTSEYTRYDNAINYSEVMGVIGLYDN